jgi:hypothetical protein
MSHTSTTERLFQDFKEMVDFMKGECGVWKSKDELYKRYIGFRRTGPVREPKVKQVYIPLTSLRNALSEVKVPVRYHTLIKTCAGRKRLAEMCSHRRETSGRS